MGNLWNDIRHSLYMFLRNPGFAIAAVAALALGIGAHSAIFTVVNTVLLKPLSYPDADRIVSLLAIYPGGGRSGGSIPKFHNWRQQTSIFKEVAAFDFTGPGFTAVSALMAGPAPSPAVEKLDAFVVRIRRKTFVGAVGIAEIEFAEHAAHSEGCEAGPPQVDRVAGSGIHHGEDRHRLRNILEGGGELRASRGQTMTGRRG